MKRVLCLYIPFLSTDALRARSANAASRATGDAGGSSSHARRRHPVGETSDSAPHPQRASTQRAAAIPVATITPHGQTIRIVHVNAAAAGCGIHPGQTLADAKAMAPQLITHEDDSVADRRTLESLAVWANCLSPTVHIESADTLLVDVTGCARLFGGESNITDQAVAGLAARGFSARVAIADTAGAARAVAHAHPEPNVVVPPGQSAAYLAPLPVWSLRIDSKTTDALRTVGVETVRSLLYLPRSSLSSRFGDHLLERIDQTMGDLDEVLTPYEPKQAVRSDFQIGCGTMGVEMLTEALRRALVPFCEELDRKAAGVRQMFVTFEGSKGRRGIGIRAATVRERKRAADFSRRGRAKSRDEGAEGRDPGNGGSREQELGKRTLELNLSQPTRSSKHLLSLLKVLLDQLRISTPIHSIILWAPLIDSLQDWQEGLFDTDSRNAQIVYDLLDRLTARLGVRAVVHAQRVSDHEPQRAFEYVPVTGRSSRRTSAPTEVGGSLDRGSDLVPSFPRSSDPFFPSLRPSAPSSHAMFPSTRPLRLLPKPTAITATALVPNGPPIVFSFHGARHTVAISMGPERIETGWWRGHYVQRDYYRVVTEAGLRCWLFRNRRDDGEHDRSSKWFLHGWFD